MADDIKIKLGLDASQLFAGLQKAFSEVSKLSSTKVDIGTTSAVNGLNNLQTEAVKAEKSLDGISDTNIKNVNSDVNKLADSLGEVGKNAQGAGGALSQVQSGLQSAFGGSFVGGIIGGGLSGVVTTAVGAITNAASAAFDEYKALDKNIANIATLGVESAGLSLNKFEGLINDLSKKAPDSASNIANGVYNAISAGISGSEEEIVKFVETASRVGVAGVADTNAAVNGLTSVVNAYGLGAAGAEQTSNVFFATIKAGKTSFNELNAGLANIVPAASAAGIQFDEVGAAIAKLTTVGIPTAQATTQLRAAIIELQKPAKPLEEVLAKVGLNASNMGEQLKKPASEGGGLINTLQMVEKAAKESGLSLTQVFGSAEAASAALSVTGKNAASALSIFEGVQKDVAEGVADKAYEAASKSIDVQFSILKNQVQGLFNDAFAGLKVIANEVIPIFMSGFDRIKAVFNDVFGNAGAPAMDFMAIIRGIANFMNEYLVASLTNVMNVGKVVFDVLVYAMDSIQQAVQPLVNSFGSGSGGLQGIFSAVTVAVKFLADLLGGALKIAIDVIAFSVGLFAKGFAVVVEGIKIAINIFNAVKDAIMSVVNEVQSFIKIFDFATDSVNGGRGVFAGFGDILNSVWEIIKGVGEAIYNFGVETINKYFIEPIKTAINWVGQIISKIADWIKSLPGVQKAIEIIQNIIEATGNFFSNIDKLITGVKANIAGVIFAVGEVGKIAKAIWDDILSLNFQGVIDKIGNAPAQIAKAFKEGKTSAEAFMATQNQVQKQAEKPVVKKVEVQTVNTETTITDDKTKDKDKNDKDKKDKKAKESFEALEKLKKDFAAEQTIIANANLRELSLADQRGEDIKAIKERQARDDAERLKLFLNKAIANVDDANKILDEKQLVTKIKPANPEQFAELESFYLNAISKLSKDKPIEPKVKLPDFKEELKGFETAVKDIEKNVEALIPKTLATSQEALDQNTAQITKYLDFIKSQNDEIEAAKTEALLGGNIAAAESFDEQIKRNVLSINTLTSRLSDYQTKSKAAIDKAAEESTLTFQLTTALQTNILDAFNSERIAKEREANEALRAEKLGALDQEEKDLTTSLAKREISFEEYAAKMADIDASRQQAMEETTITFFDRLKEVQDKTIGSLLRSQSAAITGFVTDQFKDAEGNVTENGKIIGESMTALTEQFASLAESGKATLGDFGNAAAGVAFDAVSKMIPAFVAGILGSSITSLGPIAGPLAAAALTASLQLLLGQAKAALGFKDGVVDLAGPGTETSDSIPAWLSRGESVITASSTRANKEELAWMNANPGMSIREYFTSQAPQVRYSVTQDGDLIREVQKLREETRGLGRQINRNTHVEISGVLKADNNSIKAMLESDRRRIARRG